jgi:SAM-dependent methyltransferase
VSKISTRTAAAEASLNGMSDRGKGVRGRSSYALAVASDIALRASRRVAVTSEAPGLAGDRWVEWSFCMARLMDGGGRTMDFGADVGFLSLAAAQRGHDVIALDREPSALQYHHPRVTAVQADILDWDPDGPFDQIINCSSVEHVGLAGRYGSTADRDGDIRAMQRMARMLNPGGRMILTVPVGQDLVVMPQHRIYGVERLPRLLEPFRSAEEQFWQKRGAHWTQTDRASALATAGSRTFYALGLFVLEK